MRTKTAPTPAASPLARVSAERLFRDIKNCLDVPFETLARYAGPSDSTLNYWAGGARANQVEALLRLLARLPASDRHRLVDKACPVFPSLAHPYLARDRVLVSELARLLRKPNGVTLVQSESAYLRSWVLTALGHSFAGAGGVAGIQWTEADWCVPVDGVTYLDPDEASAPRLDAAVLRKAGLFLCHGGYLRWPGLRHELQKTSAVTHVVLGEASLSLRELDRFHSPRHVVRVGVDGRYTQRTDDAAFMLLKVEEATH